METKLKKLTKYYGVFDYWKEEAKNLERKEFSFIACDLDLTLFSREQQLKDSKELRENRGESGTKYIVNEMGIKNYIDAYYKDVSYPKEILKKLNPKVDIILTAGAEDLQVAKIKAMGLTNYKVITMRLPEEKIIKLIKYVIYELHYIPQEIIVYEDRPNFFIEYKDLIEDVLDTKLTIMLVEMDGNQGYKKIEEV